MYEGINEKFLKTKIRYYRVVEFFIAYTIGIEAKTMDWLSMEINRRGNRYLNQSMNIRP